MPRSVNRRRFIQTSAATVGAGYFVAAGLEAKESRSANERIRFACIGVGGKGSSDSDDASSSGDVVAVCDVDEITLNGRAKALKVTDTSRRYSDFRKLLDECEKHIDAVTVSTPDHCHAAAALMAMRMGKHAFCQKPMTRTIYEARLMGDIARKNKLATQMGNQGTSNSGVRQAAKLLQGGILGKVLEVHVWTNRPIWAQGGDRPKAAEPVKHLHWDEWLGPSPERPFANGYHPFAWRGWWDFGTGALGDMACHTVNMPFMGLDLRNPTAVQATTSGHNGDSYPKWSTITYDFPANEKRPALKFYWYDGGKRPAKELFEGQNPSGSGSLIIGDKGKLYSPDDYGAEFYIRKWFKPGDEVAAKVEFPESPGHFKEWVRAIQGGEPAMSNFPDYAGPLTETILLGNLAVWAAKDKETPGKKIEWDAQKLVATNAEEVMHVVKPTYRKGYTLDEIA